MNIQLQIKSVALCFYPGSVWVKRLGHITMIALVATNLSIGQFQSQLLQQAQGLGQQVTLLTNPAIDQTESLTDVILPQLKSVELSQFGWTLEILGVPSSTEVANSIQELKTWKAELIEFQQMLALASTLLWWLEVLIWVQIAYSAAWLACDLAYGSKRNTTIFLFIVAIAINALSYIYLVPTLNH